MHGSQGRGCLHGPLEASSPGLMKKSWDGLPGCKGRPTIHSSRCIQNSSFRWEVEICRWSAEIKALVRM